LKVNEKKLSKLLAGGRWEYTTSPVYSLRFYKIAYSMKKSKEIENIIKELERLDWGNLEKVEPCNRNILEKLFQNRKNY
jgi:hypothetical protein